ncbi:MAG: 50S ribosomal protein L30 [Thermoleophilia bacterium]|jgi:large subunit ribosomal protein L30
MSQIKVTQTKSIIGRREDHRRTIRALGLKRINHTVIHDDNPVIQGMIHKVRYMVEVEELTK